MTHTGAHPNLHPELGGYSHVRTAASELVFISGQVPLTPAGELAGNDPESQARQVVDNLVAALAMAGLGPSDVMKLTAYVTSMEAGQSLATARASCFTAPLPASTVVLVPALLSGDWMLEVEAVAARSEA